MKLMGKSLLAGALLPLALIAPASATDTHGTVTRGEYNRLEYGMSRNAAQGVMDATGHRVSVVRNQYNAWITKAYNGSKDGDRVVLVFKRHRTPGATPLLRHKSLNGDRQF